MSAPLSKGHPSAVASFGPGSTFAVAAAASASAPSQVQFHRHSDDPLLLRSLLTSWHGIFAALQATAPTLTDDATRRAYLLHQSKAYRAELEAFLHAAALANHNNNSSNGQATHSARYPDLAALRVLETGKALWHLFEIAHLDPHANITAQYLDWLQRTAEPPAYLNTFIASATGSSNGGSSGVHSAAYWAAVGRLLACGRVVDAVRLLAANDVLETQAPGARELLVTLVLTCPTFAGNAAIAELASSLNVSLPSLNANANVDNDDDDDGEDGENSNGYSSASGVSGSASVDALQQQFLLWQRDVASARASAVFAALPETAPLLELLAGEAPALAAASESWTELLGATLAFKEPWASRDAVTWLADKACHSKNVTISPNASASAKNPNASAASVFDCALFAILSTDALLSLQAVHGAVRLPFLSAHLADLLAHTAQTTLPTTVALASAAVAATGAPALARLALETACDPAAPLDLREWYLVAFADTYAGTPLWPLAVTYYEHCLSQGRARIAVLVARTAPDSAATTNKLLALCAKYGLVDEARAVAAAAAAGHHRAGRPAAAVSLALRGGLEDRARGYVAATVAAAVDAAGEYAREVGATLLSPATVTRSLHTHTDSAAAAGSSSNGFGLGFGSGNASSTSASAGNAGVVVSGLGAWCAPGAHIKHASASGCASAVGDKWAAFAAARARLVAVIGVAAAHANSAGPLLWLQPVVALTTMWARIESIATALHALITNSSSNAQTVVANAGAGASSVSAATTAAAMARSAAAALRLVVSLLSHVALPPPQSLWTSASVAAGPDAAAASAAAVSVVVTPPVQAYLLRTAGQLVVLAATAEATAALAVAAAKPAGSTRNAHARAHAHANAASAAVPVLTSVVSSVLARAGSSNGSGSGASGNGGSAALSVSGATVLLRALTNITLAGAAAVPVHARLAALAAAASSTAAAGADEGKDASSVAAGAAAGGSRKSADAECGFEALYGLEGVNEVLAAQLAVAMQDPDAVNI